MSCLEAKGRGSELSGGQLSGSAIKNYTMQRHVNLAEDRYSVLKPERLHPIIGKALVSLSPKSEETGAKVKFHKPSVNSTNVINKT